MIWWLALFASMVTALILVRPLLPAKSSNAKAMISVFMLLFVGAALGTYHLIGSPKLSDSENLQAFEPPNMEDQIQGMVASLAARLAEEPNDPEGWTRLIRSRIVLGDIPGAIEDHKTMREVFKDQPELIKAISMDSSFDDMAKRALGERAE